MTRSNKPQRNNLFRYLHQAIQFIFITNYFLGGILRQTPKDRFSVDQIAGSEWMQGTTVAEGTCERWITTPSVGVSFSSKISLPLICSLNFLVMCSSC